MASPSGRAHLRARHAVAFLLALAALPADAARQRSGNLDAFVVLDESGSMKPIFARVTAYLADALVRGYLVPGDSLVIVGFSDRPRVRVSQRLQNAAEQENLAAIVRDLNVVPEGYTDMGRVLETLQAQLERLADPAHQQVVLILTDGLNQPPRDSPYFDPLRPDTGRSFAPPSRFNPRFLEQVRGLAGKGYRVHVVGIGLETDARALAEALGSGHTLLREFDARELQTGLSAFWDDSLNLAGATAAASTWLPERVVALKVRVRSASDKPREVQLAGVRIVELRRLGAGAAAGGPVPRLAAASERWLVPARQEAAFDVTAELPKGFPPGDYELLLAFDQKSAVKFYPAEARLAFHVPSFWELHGRGLVASSLLGLGLCAAVVLHRRRPISIALVLEGEAGELQKPVRLAIGDAASLGGGATDRFRVAGLPQRVASFERRAVGRFALLSSKPELVPTLIEYSLGEPVELRLGGGPAERKLLRFVRATRRAANRPARALHPATRKPGPEREPGGVDFR